MSMKNMKFLLVFLLIGVTTWQEVNGCKKQQIREERPVIVKVKDDPNMDMGTGKSNADPPKNGFKALERAEHHWLISIYTANDLNNFNFKCFGNILDGKFILTVATCVTDVKTGHIHTSDRYMVAAGKQFSDINDPRDDAFVQKRQVSEIMVAQGYKGIENYFMYDLAVLKLKESLIFNDIVKPISLDYMRGFRVDTGLTGINFGYKNRELRKFTFTVLDKETCKRKVPNHFLSYITEDKFFAESMDEDFCLGASGSGLVFQAQDGYHLKGVASVAPQESNECLAKYPMGFTNVEDHLQFITRSQREVDENINIRNSV